jgi:hypothetical protein
LALAVAATGVERRASRPRIRAVVLRIMADRYQAHDLGASMALLKPRSPNRRGET